MSEEKLKKWICTKPFNYLDVNHGGSYMCCPSWLPEDITEGGTKTITEGWFSEKSDAIRASMLDGSFRYCDHKVCPEISAVLAGEEEDRYNNSAYLKLKDEWTPPETKIELAIPLNRRGVDREIEISVPAHDGKVQPDN